jgi:Domain of unknown function (DUF4417)
MKLNDFFTPNCSDRGMPLVKATDFIPNDLQAYRAKKQAKSDRTLHFFVDDYRFENLWNFPYRYLEYLKKFEAVIAPDFSLYLNYPTPVKIWNTYRNRWLSAFWQQSGITVIPCVSWAEESSFDFCFDGLPHSSVVAIASMGIKKRDRSAELFFLGVKELITRIKPIKVLVYGEKFRQELGELSKIFQFYSYYRKSDGR